VGVIVELRITLADESEVRLVDQGGRLQRQACGFVRDPGRGEVAKFVIDEWKELFRGCRIAPADGSQKAGGLPQGV